MRNIKKGKFTTKMQKKLVILFVIVLLAFVGLSAKLIVINKDNGEQYKKQVLSQQQYDSKTIPYKRGNIVDVKGTGMAVSEKVYNVVLDCKLLLEKEAYLEPTMKALKDNFAIDENTVRAYIKANPTSQYYVMLKQLTYDQVSPFVEMQNDPEKYPNIQGIWFEEEYRRVYPYNTLACDILGFTNKDNNGTYGLEEYYNNILNGTTGRQYGYLNDDETLERTTKAAVDGDTIVTTIDVNIQSIVEKYILQFNEEHKNEYREGLGSENTGVIVMDPNTGEILAMASYPVFDLNDPYNISAYYTEDQIKAMDETTLSDAYSSLWKNFCISDTYEPGSTAKPFTVAAGLETGKLTGNETYVCNGSLEVGDHLIHCHNTAGDGVVTIQQAIEKSCNVALMQMAFSVGQDDFMKYEKIFNFGLKTNVDLAGEARTDALVYDPATMVKTDLAVSSFGQGYNVTMIQQATAFCSLINGGYYYQPHMVSKITTVDGATVENIEPRVLKQTISGTTSDTIMQYCNGVVTNGTGKTARPAGYTMGGKTGTAETVPRKMGNYVVSFMGYAPADDPQVLIYVVIDKPNVEAQDNARYATVLTRNIMTEVLPYMNIFMTEELSEEEQKEIAERDAAQQLLIDSSLSANSVSGNGVSGNSVSGNSVSTNAINTNKTDKSNEKAVSENKTALADYKIDKETGYAIDPKTGEFLDPETGVPIDPTHSFID